MPLPPLREIRLQPERSTIPWKYHKKVVLHIKKYLGICRACEAYDNDQYRWRIDDLIVQDSAPPASGAHLPYSRFYGTY